MYWWCNQPKVSLKHINPVLSSSAYLSELQDMSSFYTLLEEMIHMPHSVGDLFLLYKNPSNPCKQIFKIKSKHWHIVANHLIQRCLSLKSKQNLTLQYNYPRYLLLFSRVLKINILK